MKVKDNTQSKVFSPALIVFLVMVAVILLSWSLSFFHRLVIGDVRASVSLDTEVEKSQNKSLNSANRTAPVQAVLNGEVYRTAERMKEIEALAAITSLYLATETMNHRQPRTCEDLLSGLHRAGLIPPKLPLAKDQRDTLTSINSTVYVRYRPAPLSVEIVSLGHVRMDGPAIIVRVPGDLGGDAANIENEASSMYVATSLNESRVPDSFAPKAELIAAGWADEPMRTKSVLADGDKSQLMSWAREAANQQPKVNVSPVIGRR